MRTTAQTQAPAIAAPSGNDPITLTLKDLPDKVGDGSEVDCVVSDDLTYRYSRLGVFLKGLHASASGHIHMVERVLAVNDQGDATEYRTYVKTLAVRTAIPAILKDIRVKFPSPDGIRCQGAIVIVKRSPKVTFARADGQPLTNADRVYLGLFYDPVRRAPADETAFDPGHPVRVGDSWTPDPTASAAVLSNGDIVLDPEDLKVAMSYDSRGPFLGTDAATVTMTAHADSLTSQDADSVLNDPSGTADLTMTFILPAAIPGRMLAIKRISVLDRAGLSKNPRLEGVDEDMRITHLWKWQLVRELH